MAGSGTAHLRAPEDTLLRAENLVVELVSTHPRYKATTRLPAALVANLAEDLA